MMHSSGSSQDWLTEKIDEAMLIVADDIAQRMFIGGEESAQKYLNKLRNRMTRLHIKSGWSEDSPELNRIVGRYVDHMKALIEKRLSELRRYRLPVTKSLH